MTADVHRPVLIYDGECGFCRLWVRRLRQLVHNAPRCEPFQTAPLEQLGVSREECTLAVQYVDRRGRVSGGSDAVARLFIGAGSLWFVPGWLLLVPGVRQVAQVSYRWVARNRHRFKGAPTAD